MDKPIAEIKKGEVAADVTFKDGKIKLAAKYDGKGADAEVSVSVDSDYFLDKLAEAIPGKIDDALFAMLKGALKGI